MSQNHFLVYLRDSAWQFSYRGSITAPFKTREQAIEAAIFAARESEEANVEVLVQDSDMRTESVWRPDNA